MKAEKIWAQNLGISDATLDSWLAQAPRHVSFTFWCLITGKITEDKYLQWAREHYGLLSLNSSYFAKSPDKNWWTQFQSVANWSENMIPLREWDGTVFIACVEPSEEVKWSFPTRYLLAKASDLKKYWDDLHSQSVAAAAVAPAAPTSPAPTTAPANLDNPSAHENSYVGLPPTPDVVIEEPDGLNLSKIAHIGGAKALDPMEALMKQFGEPKSDELPPTEVAASADVFAPEGLHLSPPPAPAPIVSAVASPPPPPTPEKNPIWDSSRMANAESMPMISLPVVPDNSQTSHDGTSTNAVSFPPIPKGAAHPDMDSATVIRSKNPQAFSEILGLLKIEFGNGMVMAVSNELLQPIAWDEHFTPSTSRARQFWSLNQPSAFRIAYRTKMPYLGHIVDTSTNKEFFAAWGFSSLPENIFVQPVLHGGQVQYLLLALCDAHKKSHYHLSSGEKLAAAFMEQITNSTSKSA